MKYDKPIRAHFTVTATSGAEYTAMCPWHSDTAKGHLYLNAAKGLYLCFVCGKKGRVDTIAADIPQTSTDHVRERIRAAKAKTVEQKFYPESWLDQFDAPHDYWTTTRSLPEDTVKRFRLGYDPFSNRLTLPLRDSRGRILGVTHRRLDDGKPKYLHPKGFPTGRHLYGAWLLTTERKVALVEGQVDAVKGWASRVPALGLMGARLTPDQLKVLQRNGIESVVLMLDNDNAGIAGTVGVYEQLQGSGIRVQAGWYRPYWNVKDPDGLTPQRYRKMYHSSLTMVEWAREVA